MLYVQNENSPSRVLFSFDDIIAPDLQQVSWSVAYATYSGCRNLVDYINQRITPDHWRESNKNFVISIDYGHTEPSALEMLAEENNSTVYIANSYLLERGTLRPSRAFHPKVYCFQYQENAGIMTGSANLSKSALHRNVEVVQTQILDYDIFNVIDFIDKLRANTELLTPQLLERYREVRENQREAIGPIPEQPAREPAEITVNVDTGWLWGAIEAGLDPSSYEYFWIEAGSMSSGGSRNQLELARGSNYFFGFNYDNFINQGPALEIGYVNLTFDGRTHLEREYRWHSNNMMERLNLPTVVQGGTEYAQKCILFRRRPQGYELFVMDWNSEEAVDWRSASDRSGVMYRISQNANPNSRVCGFL